MRKLVMGCTLAALVALTPRTEARPLEKTVPVLAPVSQASQPMSERGIAGWYGEEFDGNPTASGEIFDMNGLTAAHRSLPLGTKLKVMNLRNHRSLVVRVNDRGPFIAGRFLDLSKEAAFRLGFMASGLAHVEAEVVSFPKGYTPEHP